MDPVSTGPTSRTAPVLKRAPDSVTTLCETPAMLLCLPERVVGLALLDLLRLAAADLEGLFKLLGRLSRFLRWRPVYLICNGIEDFAMTSEH